MSKRTFPDHNLGKECGDRFRKSRLRKNEDGFTFGEPSGSRSHDPPLKRSRLSTFFEPPHEVRKNYPQMRNFTKTISLQKLKALSKKEPFIITLELTKEDSGYNRLLDEDKIDSAVLGTVVKLLSKAVTCKTNNSGVLDLLIISFSRSNFVTNLMTFVSGAEEEKTRVEEYFPLICLIIEQFFKMTPSYAFTVASNLTYLCLGVLKSAKFADTESLEQMFSTVQVELKAHREKYSQNSQTKRPFDNFRDQEVVPTCDELNRKHRPFLRPVITQGSYENSHHYLDVQFRLLKEDFVRPLREGVQHFRASSSKSKDVRVYTHVFLHHTCIDGPDLVHCLKLKLPNYFRAAESKRLMFGNILCISCDSFETMVIAVVKNRDQLKEGLLGVTIESEPFTLDYNISYSVVESKAYFVSYMHTLKALKEFDTVPFEEYIVKGIETNASPNYLHLLAAPDMNTSSSHYNPHRPSALPSPSYTDNSSKPELSGENCLTPSVTLEKADLSLSSADLHLDESQMRALRSALTRQLAIIQGPPGTGKTFLGLHIARILLCTLKSPILVVCYTNHALDQFLDGISSFTERIVRVGSRSKSDSLRRFQLKNLLREHDCTFYEKVIKNKYREVCRDSENLKAEISILSDLSCQLKVIGILNVKSFTQGKYSVIGNPLKKLLKPYSMANFLTLNEAFDQSRLTFSHNEAFDKSRLTYVHNEAFDKSRLTYVHNPMCGQQLQYYNATVLQPFQPTVGPQYPVNPSVDEVGDQGFDLAYEDENQGLNMEEEHHRILDDEEYEEIFQQVLPVASCHYPELCYEVTLKDIEEKNNKEEQDYYLKNIMKTIPHHEVNEYKCESLEFLHLRDLNNLDRFNLYCYWKKKLEVEIQKELKKREKMYGAVHKKLNDLKNLQYLSVMKRARVVGMTTTGAAQYCKLLHDLAPPVVIIEEAAEILEAHVITSLSPSCEHLIMIGDHQQLRPKTNVFELAKHFHLEVSLFERLIKNGIQYEMLEYQHRMRPEFSRLLVPLIYRNLKDHDSVHNYPKIKGMDKDLFFIDHTELEKPLRPHWDSFENVYEAEFLMALCRHLLLQGYSTDDITIITPYSGQFLCFKKLQNDPVFSGCRGVRISILDNYQGEESNIILLSLVRSNEEEKVGFIKMESRVCVALSRAKQGMYIMGNMTQLAKSNPLWENINQSLIASGNIGPKLQLKCSSHPDEELMVGSREEFIMKAPEGGCRHTCSASLLNCDHKCQKLCHAYDKMHTTEKCNLPCKRIICEVGHQCPEKCYQQPCLPCKVYVEKKFPCGHEHAVKCHITSPTFQCPTLVEKEFELCKHKLQVCCHIDLTTIKCIQKCSTRLDCGHKCVKKCHPTKDPDHERYNCYRSCEKLSPNCEFQHKCLDKCYEYCGPCKTVVNHKLDCGHIMKHMVCGYRLQQCSFWCTETLPCGHKCPKLCGQECGECMVPVKKNVPVCQHDAMVPCSVLPDSTFCFGMCVKKMDCGHPCQNKCYEPCTDALNCKEMVWVGHACPRGHPMNFPCHMIHFDSLLPVGSSTALEERTIGECCTKICGAMLDCEHLCKGTCGLCLNGRFHSKCRERCGKVLVCGHVCKAPCSAVCPPCQEPCMWRCKHSICKKKCGVPCIPCKETCTRRCPHSACSAKCGDRCDSNPCSVPCPKRLKCGHDCIGFCGEPCPSLCRICDKEKVSKIIFGTEDERDARFVLLEDCEHVCESTVLEKWLNTESVDGDAQIGMKKCPLCTTSIYNTTRYRAFILDAYDLVSKVKGRYFPMKTNITRDSLLTAIKGLENNWPHEISLIKDRIGHGTRVRPVSYLELSLLDLQIRFLNAAKDVKTRLQGKERKLCILVKSVMANTIRVSAQFIKEAFCELRRLDVSISVERIRQNTYLVEDVKSILTKIDEIMKPELRFDQDLEDQVVARLKDAEKFMGFLRITNQERLQIIQAMGFGKQGHWYKCPNGHIYCIADCGGAVMESSCPECRATIGGSSHRLRSDNSVATEMDGARTSAWPG